MPTEHGDLRLLEDPAVQRLLQSAKPARLAYVWRDGTPRVVPMWFHWTGESIVMGTSSKAPKMRALPGPGKVALVIDEDTYPYKSLTIRGAARTELYEGVFPEYVETARRYLGEEGANAFLQQLGSVVKKMAKITVTPEWVGLLDFTRLSEFGLSAWRP